MLSIISILPLLALFVASPVSAQRYCRNRYGQIVRCSGLSYGARIGIGLGVAFGVLLIFACCGYCRRKQLRAQYAKYRPPALPQHNADPSNPYANNPPPPAAGSYYPNQQSGNDTNWNQNSYGNNPPAPAQTYQPSTAAQYKAGNNAEGQEHGYEWEQAREQERLERENGGGGNNGPAPPGYDVANSAQNTGSQTGYAPPPGAPPPKR